MLRVICSEAPRKPVAAAGCGWKLDADLDAILLKALRKEPRERYLTAEHLATDVRAYLDGLPVAARRGNYRYRAAKFIRRNRLALAGAALLAATLLAGVLGVLWQAKVANEERRKAEARSADLRQLSNSLLSELDEAIQQLPGSTGVQHLLVTRVLEHLDRMAKDAQGDRQTRLDLIDAYSRLANIQGNTYAQNLGDVAGALSSIDKAIALAKPLGDSGPQDIEALRALALAQMYRSQILFGTPRMQEMIASMQAAIQTYDRIVAIPGVTPVQLCEAATAYGVLGDELGQGGSESLNDLPGAITAYQKDLDLIARALSIDPNMIRAKRALAIGQLKIAETESETDPAKALKDFLTGLERVNVLPKNELSSLRIVRVRNSLLEGEAEVLVELGEYSSADTLYTEVVQTVQHLAAADPQDSRALFDLQTVLDQKTAGFEAAADPDLSAVPGGRRGNLAAAEKILIQEIDVLERILKQDPSNDECKPVLYGAQVRLATIQSILHPAADSATLARKGLSAFKDLARNDQASPSILDQAASAFLKVKPAFLRDPQFAISSAQRAVALSHGKTPSMLLTLAQAYRASGQMEKSRATAREGLALLPASQQGGAKPRIRKLLEIQAQPKH
jgi:lambda repressor-like predicted transcriptional regulator